MGVQLAEEDGAGIAQPGPDGGVVVGDEVGQDLGAGRRGDPGRVEEVLQPDGDAGQRAERPAGRPGLVGGGGGRPGRLEGGGDEGLHHRVEPLDPVDAGIDELPGRERAGGQQRPQLDDGQVGRIAHY